MNDHSWYNMDKSHKCNNEKKTNTKEYILHGFVYIKFKTNL